MIDVRSVVLTGLALFLLGLFYIAGYDFGRRSLVVDIDTYGCEKVVKSYHGVGKK